MAEPTPLLSLIDVRHAFLSRPILDGVTLTLNEGDRAGLLGANGAGKSTLLKIAAGLLVPDSGDVRSRRALSVARLDQDFKTPPGETVRAWIDGAFEPLRAMERELDGVHHRLGEAPLEGPEHDRLLERQAALHHALEERGLYHAGARAERAMAALGLPEGDRTLGSLSGGELRRTTLCRVLLEAPDLLLLDEPTNHLDTAMLDWLEEFLAAFPGAVLIVTHDRHFLDAVCTRMIELEAGKTKAYDGNYEDYLVAKDEESAIEARAEANRQRFLKLELDWLRRQPKARTTKAKARVDRAASVLADAPRAAERQAQFLLPDPPRLGNTVIEAEHIFRAKGGRELAGGFTFTMVPGDRVVIVGPNGAGKTTLMRLLLRLEAPDRGIVRHGANLVPVYADQMRADLDPERTVIDEVAGDADWLRVGGERISVRAYLRRFLFSEELAAMPIKRLSGGERSRALLAKLLRQGGNLIALDEPTNDLDLHTLRVLEEALTCFEGCALLVSHDRYFINRVATRMLWVPGDGTVHEVAGNYEHLKTYQRKLAERPSAPAPAPAARAAKPGQERGAGGKPRKLTFNEQREFDAIEGRILEAEASLAEIVDLLNNPETYMKLAGPAIADLQARRREAEAAVEQLYHRWSELGERA